MKSIHSSFERTRAICILLGLLISFNMQSQTHPLVQPIPFVLTEYSLFTRPANMAIHGFTNPQTSINLSSGNTNMDFGTTGWYPQKENGISFRGGGNGDYGYSGALLVAVNTKEKSFIAVQWKYRLITQNSSRDNSMILQYRVGTAGVFTNVEATTYSSTNISNGDSMVCKIVLPTICENKPIVQLRWFYWHSAGSAGSQDVIAVDDIYIKEGLGSIAVTSEALTFKFQKGVEIASKELLFSMVGTESKVQIAISPDFELSTDQVQFSSTIEIPPSLAAVEVSIWVRPGRDQAIGNHIGAITFSIFGAALATQTVSSEVISPPPTAYPSGFHYNNQVSLLGQDLTLGWVNATLGVVASSYLLVINQPDFMPDDGVDYSQTHIVLPSTDDHYPILDPKVGDSYHIRLFPYTNIGSDILYKRDNAPPILSFIFDPIIGSKSYPYTLSGLQTAMSQSSFGALWVRVLISTYVQGQLTIVDSAPTLSNQEPISLVIDYPEAPISTHVIAHTPLLICLSWDQDRQVLKGLSSVFECVIVSVKDGLWSDRDIWQPGIPTSDNEVVLSHAVTLTDSTKIGVIRLSTTATLRVAPTATLRTKGIIFEKSNGAVGRIDNQGAIERPHISIEQELEHSGIWNFISLPFDLYSDGVEGFSHSDDPLLSQPNSYYLRYYDGALRAQLQSDQNLWISQSVEQTLSKPIMEANVGYLISVNAAASTNRLSFRSRDSTHMFDPNISLPLTAHVPTDGGVSIHNGWNLVANPYPSPYSLASHIDKSLAGAFAYQYDGVTYQVVELGVADEPLIAPFTPFFVKAARSDPWVLPSSIPQSMALSIPIPEIKLTISQDQWSDQTVIRLNALSTDAYNPLLDAAKFTTIHPQAPQIFTIHNEQRWAIRSIPLDGLSHEILLECLLPQKGSYRVGVTLSDTDHLEGIYWQREGEMVDLSRTPEFTLTTETPFAPCLVRLMIVKSVLDTLVLPKDRNLLYIEQRRLYLYLPLEGASLTVFDLAGTLVMQGDYPKGASTATLSLSSGCYLFHLKQGKKSQIVKMVLFK